MDTKRINEGINPICLKVAITESILLNCIKGSSFSEIELHIPRVISTSKAVLKEYMYHLVNNSFISYNRVKKVYLIEARWLGPIIQNIFTAGEFDIRLY